MDSCATSCLTFPERGSVSFREFTCLNAMIEKFLRITTTCPVGTIEDRATLFRNVVRGQIHENPEITIHEQNKGEPDWLDMSLESLQQNWAAGDDNLSIENHGSVEDLCPTAPTDGEKPAADQLLSIEDIGEELQTKLLELKGALHNEEPQVDVDFILELQGDVIACVANELSSIPSNHICVILKSILARNVSHMLQRDIGLLLRHLVLAHLKQPSATAGATLLSCGVELASRWSELFAENLVLPSLHSLTVTLSAFLSKSLKAFDSEHSQQMIILLLKSAREKPASITEQNLNQVLQLAEICVSNCYDFNEQVFVELRAVYRAHENVLRKNRTFAKNLLDIVKRTKILHENSVKAAVTEILTSMIHPMRNIILKLIDSKS